MKIKFDDGTVLRLNDEERQHVIDGLMAKKQSLGHVRDRTWADGYGAGVVLITRQDHENAKKKHIEALSGYDAMIRAVRDLIKKISPPKDDTKGPSDEH